MFQKNSLSFPSDSSGVLVVKVIQTRRVSTRRHAVIGTFLRVVLKSVKPELWRRRKKKVRAIVIRSKMFYFRKDGMSYRFANNSLVLLKKRMNTIGRELYGPTTKNLKIKKFRVAFKYIY
jgi:ribosomal protein L14